MLIALKIDVDTLRGTREGVPRLVGHLRDAAADATFLFSLGPDHTGRAITRIFRPGFVRKVRRTSVVEHYGIKTLLYGTLLPGPDIGVRAADIMRLVRDQGFEVGIHCWDHVKWQDRILTASAQWTAQQMTRACERFTDIFKAPPKTHGAAGWQMNVHALRLTQRLGFDYCSDTRGTEPFLPVWNAELVRCPQLPTTLPTLDELIGLEGVTRENAADHILRLTANSDRANQVFTLHAELEGMMLAPLFKKLLQGWREQGHSLVSLRSLFNTLVTGTLPRCEVDIESIPGRTGKLARQTDEFLMDEPI